MSDSIPAVKRALEAGNRRTDIELVFPIIVPRSYFAHRNWPGPYAVIRFASLAMTWTILHPEQTMVYVNHDRAAVWEQEGVAWREQAHVNLQRASAGSLWTHEKRADDGRLLWAAMMHSDGLGSSRLVLRAELAAALNGDYRIGIPDRSCGIVIPVTSGEANMAEVAALVRNMYTGATTPMMSELLSPDDLETIDS